MIHNSENIISTSKSSGSNEVLLDLRRKALEAISGSDLYIQALNQKKCSADFWLEPKTFFEKSYYQAEIKENILEELSDTNEVLMVALTTSDGSPGGIIFEFILHPTKLHLIYAGTSLWYAS